MCNPQGTFLRKVILFSGFYRIHGNKIIISSDTGHCRQSDSRTSVTTISVIWVQTLSQRNRHEAVFHFTAILIQVTKSVSGSC